MCSLTKLDTFHKDLIHDVSFDYYGTMLATCSSDQTIKIWKYTENNNDGDNGDKNKWICMQQINHTQHTHKSAINHICWAHPVFGSIFASCSTDKKINIFALRDSSSLSMYNFGKKKQKFLFQRVFLEFHDAVSIVFAPQHLGLKLSILCNDGVIKILTARDITNLNIWTHEYSINIASSSSYFKSLSQRQQYANNKNMKITKSKSYTNNMDIDRNTNNMNNNKNNKNNENIKSFCISWNESKWELPAFAVGTNKNRVFIYKYFDKNNDNKQEEKEKEFIDSKMVKRATTNINTMKKNIDWHCVSKIQIAKNKDNKYFDIHGISWSHHLARKYHLIAIGCSDGFVRIIKINRNKRIINPNNTGINPGKLEWNVIFESNIHNDSVWKVKWNVTGNILLSAGDDAKIYLWKRNRINVDQKYIPICISNGKTNNKHKNSVHDHQ